MGGVVLAFFLTINNKLPNTAVLSQLSYLQKNAEVLQTTKVLYDI